MGIAEGTEVENSGIAAGGFDPIHFPGFGFQGPGPCGSQIRLIAVYGLSGGGQIVRNGGHPLDSVIL